MITEIPWRPWEKPESLAGYDRPLEITEEEAQQIVVSYGRRLAKTSEVADALGLRPCTIQAYARKGRVPYNITPGGHRRFNIDEVRAALREKPAMTAARNDFNREVSRLAPEILRDPVAYAVVHMAEVVFGEYEQRLMHQARSQAQYSSPKHQAARGDGVEVWLKRWRDSLGDHDATWHIVDDILEDYRLHGDTGTPLDEEVET